MDGESIAPEDDSDMLSLFLDDDELLGNAPVAERHGSTDPEALSFGGGDLVTDTLSVKKALIAMP